MTLLYHIALSGSAENAADQINFVTILQELLQLRHNDDYKIALEQMSMEGFTEYYTLFFDLVNAMGLESVKDLSDWRVVSTDTLPDSISRANRTREVVELLDGFNALELADVSFTDRMKTIERILGDLFVTDNKEQQILKILASMNAEEQSTFLTRLTDGDDPLLERMLRKVGGKEKISLFQFLQTIFLASDLNIEGSANGPTLHNDPSNYQSVEARIRKGKIAVTQFGQVQINGAVTQTGSWEPSPFDQITYALRDESYTIPALFLTDQEALSAAVGKETFLSVLWGALQGEFNEDPTGKQILADIGINFIPIVGQVCDARDIAACLHKLINEGRVSEMMVWVTLLLTAIGCIPYAGDVVKGALKAIIKGADDVALVLVKKVGGDNVVIALRLVSSKLEEAVPEIRKLIQGWAEDAAKKGSPNAAQFFAKMDEMIDSAARLIRNKIDDFGRKVGGESEESITPLIRNQRRVEAISKLTGYNPTRAVEVIEEYQGLIFNPRKKLWEVDNITIRQENGRWIYNGPSGDVPEWKIKDRHNDVCSSRTTGTKTLFQSHHGIQDAWASIRLEAFGYKSENAPTIMLRDSCRGTPHQAITANQAGRKAERDLLTRTYKRERDLVKIELLESGGPQASINEYLLKADTYFKQFYDKMNPTERLRIFGSFSF